MIYVVATTPVKPGQIDAFIAGHKKVRRRDAEGKGLRVL